MKAMLDINVLALIECDNRVLKSMMDRGVDDGHIIHINRYVTKLIMLQNPKLYSCREIYAQFSACWGIT